MSDYADRLRALADRWRSNDAARSELIAERRRLVADAKAAGMTRAEIADALDVTQPFVTRLLAAAGGADTEARAG